MVNRIALDIPIPDNVALSNVSVLETAMLWKFWKICRISLASETVGYEHRFIPQAHKFFCEEIIRNRNDAGNNFVDFLNHVNPDIKATLFYCFRAQNSAVDADRRAAAGLCLRCSVSYPLLKACQKIDSLFGGEKRFTYRDLLPFVINDDGKTLIILDSAAKTQLVLNGDGKTQPTNYKFFSVEVLRTFKPDSQSSMSLDNWAYFQTKQNPEVKDFLSEFGLQHLSDWAILNRARPKQIESLSERDRQLIQVFHAVYRRDRREHRPTPAKKCPDPSNSQLQQMLICLQKQNVTVHSNVELLDQLKQVAVQLKQYDVWSCREPLEIRDPDTGNEVIRQDLPNDSRDELDLDHQEILEFLDRQLTSALTQAIEQEIKSCIAKLEKSKRYAIFAQKFIPGLQLYYCQAMPLKEIVPLLGMTSWDQARRILNPGEILNNVKERTLAQVLDSTIAKAREKGLTQIPPEPEYLKTLTEQIEAFADAEIFEQAAEEIRAGKNREMNSFYAEQLRVYFSKFTPLKPE